MGKYEKKLTERREIIHRKIVDGISLTHEEKWMLIDEKKEKKEPLTFEDFKFIFLEVNLDIAFIYKNKRYELIHGIYFSKGESVEETEIYTSNEDLLLNARIDGKSLEEIWDEVEVVS